jgi:S-adenosylmethionine hydrolase
MPLITFLSDYGCRDHYVAAVKAKIFSLDASLPVIDITHHIEHFNVAHGSFVLKSVFRDFPENTVHMVAINSVGQRGEHYLALRLENHFFVGTDNGLLGLLSEQEPEEIVRLPSAFTTFPAKDIFAPAAVSLARGAALATVGKPTTKFKKMLPRQLKATKTQISGNVVQVDNYGNLITNIDKQTFDHLNSNNSFRIVFGRETSEMVCQSYQETDCGDCFLLFNSLGLLEIGIHNGNASELLGLEFDSPVHVHFD